MIFNLCEAHQVMNNRNYTLDEKVEEREYKPFYEIKNMYPKYLFTSDVLLQDRDGVINVNIADFIYNNKEL